jgi:hypothetical protein
MLSKYYFFLITNFVSIVILRLKNMGIASEFSEIQQKFHNSAQPIFPFKLVNL